MADCVTRVELHVSCRGLLDKDTTSKSDPLCAMYIQDAHGKWNEVSSKSASLLRDPKRTAYITMINHLAIKLTSSV